MDTHKRTSEGVKKTYKLRTRGRDKPPGTNQNRVFSEKKEKKMQNVLKRKNMQKYFVTFLQEGHPLKHFSRYFHKILKFIEVFFL